MVHETGIIVALIGLAGSVVGNIYQYIANKKNRVVFAISSTTVLNLPRSGIS